MPTYDIRKHSGKAKRAVMIVAAVLLKDLKKLLRILEADIRGRVGDTALEGELRAEWQAAREAKLDEFHDKLTGAVERLVTGDDWADALRFAAKFRSRSFNNVRDC